MSGFRMVLSAILIGFLGLTAVAIAQHGYLGFFELAMANWATRVLSADLVIVAGTSSMVYPAAALPAVAHQAGAWTLEINPEPTRLSDRVDERIEAPSGTALPALLAAAGFRP